MPKKNFEESLEKTPKLEEAYLRPVSDSKESYCELNPNAPRKYKAITVTFNEFEYRELETVCKVLDRGKNDAIRFLIRDRLKVKHQH